MAANVVTLTVRFILNDYLPDSNDILTESVERYFRARFGDHWPQIEEVETDVELFGERWYNVMEKRDTPFYRPLAHHIDNTLVIQNLKINPPFFCSSKKEGN
jgi:hypothetical protein